MFCSPNYCEFCFSYLHVINANKYWWFKMCSTMVHQHISTIILLPRIHHAYFCFIKFATNAYVLSANLDNDYQGCQFSFQKLLKKEFLPFVGDFIPFFFVQIFHFKLFSAYFGAYNPNLSTLSFCSFLLTKCCWYPWITLITSPFITHWWK